MSTAMQNGQFLRIVLWMLALLLIAAGLVVDHKYGGFKAPERISAVYGNSDMAVLA